MRLLLRLLLLIPLALLVAIGAGWLFLMMATVVSPELATLVINAFQRLGDWVFDEALSGADPEPALLAAGWRGLQLSVAILIAPVVVTALASELFRWGSGLGQMALTGLLSTALPAALLGLSRAPTPAELRILAALFLTGVVSGFFYWAIAGRGAAGGGAPAPVSGPRA